MHLTTLADHGGCRSWRGLDWEVLGRLHGKGWISDPATKAKSVVWTDDGRRLSESLFEKHFRKIA